jgi:hypothetical protein
MCGKCWHQNLEGLEKADNRVPWLELVRASDYESGGQEFESLRARHEINGLGYLSILNKSPVSAVCPQS